MDRTKALITYLAGSIGQILIVCIIVFFLRKNGLDVGYSTPTGLLAIAMGGISTCLWGTITLIKYRNNTIKSIACDFFKIKQNPMNYLLVLIFLALDFFPVFCGGSISLGIWYVPILMFFKHIAFGGLEEIGWRYCFQPLLQERLNYLVATILTFVAWSIWHFLFFYIDETQADIIPFLIGLLTNSFILSALYVKTKNLWLCVMTHSLINVLSQVATYGSSYAVYICKIVIIGLAITLSVKEQD